MIKKIIFFIIFFIISNVSFAQSANNNVCDKFYDQIRVKNSELELYQNPIWIQEDSAYGFLIKSDYNDTSDTWVYNRDKNYNITVFKSNYK